MASDKQTSSPDLNALAAEALNLWQEHLSAYANDPQAKAELIRLMEPQRRLFADWTAMMQNAPHGNGFTPPAQPDTAPATGTAAPSAASDDGALRVAQLAHRVAQLEQHIAELEQQLNKSGTAGASEKSPRRTK